MIGKVYKDLNCRHCGEPIVYWSGCYYQDTGELIALDSIDHQVHKCPSPQSTYHKRRLIQEKLIRAAQPHFPARRE